MKNITINYKIKTKLINTLLKQDNIKELKKHSFISKLTFTKKEYADIYLFTGSLDNDTIANIKNAKKVICNSLSSEHKLIIELKIPKEKIEVIYPFFEIDYNKPKEVKKEFCEKYKIDKDKKLVFFTANNFKSSGVLEFINIISSLNYRNMMAIIAGNKTQISNLRFKLSKYNLEDKILLLENYENMDELFLASDIFILPTYNKSFAINVLKAMYCKCAVFTTVTNASKELIDIFSTMETPEDRSMQFKVVALLQNKSDLKLIKNQNRKIAKNYTLEKALEKITKIIEDI